MDVKEIRFECVDLFDWLRIGSGGCFWKTGIIQVS
jgi:hypothetical protein